MRRLWTAALLALPVVVANAADSPFTDASSAAPVRSPFTATLFAPTETLAAGAVTTLRVQVHVPAGHYVYDERTTLEVLAAPGLEIVGIDRPRPETKLEPFLEEEVQVLKHDTVFAARVRVQQSSLVRLVFSTQGCSGKFCYFPQSDTLVAQLTVAGLPGAGVASPDRGPANAAPGSDVGKGTAEAPNASAPAGPSSADQRLRQAASRGVFWLFLLAFTAGILTSFTPCVYPMIPITIGIIGARSAGKRSKGFTLSLLYVLGIAVTYSALGTSAALTGSLFGSVLQNKFVVMGVAGVFIVMAMSLFGAFEMQVPPALAGRLNSVQGNGYPGAFLFGLIAGVVASPCVGPVLVAMLAYVATTGSAALGFGLFFTFALGLGLLFIVLGTFTGVLASLPKSGAWMVRVKIVFGLVFLALALYYLHPHLPHTRTLLPVGAVLVVLGLGLGATREIIESEPTAKRWRKALGRAAVIAGLYGLVVPLLPGSQGRAIANPPWLASEGQGLERARAESKPMLIDFSADWCVACKELERFTFSDPRVIELARRFVPVHIDATKNTPAMRALMQKYGIRGLPWVAFVRPDGTILQELTVTGFLAAEPMLARMMTALPDSGVSHAGTP